MFLFKTVVFVREHSVRPGLTQELHILKSIVRSHRIMVLVTIKIYINFVTFSIFKEDTLGHSPGQTNFVTSSKAGAEQGMTSLTGEVNKF